MKKEKEKLFDDVAIDSKAAAYTVKENAETVLEKVTKSMKIALASEICWAICFICGMIGSVESIFATINLLAALAGIVLAIVALVMSGGIGNALKFCLKIGKIGWTIVPIIVVDLFIGAMGAVFALCGVIIVPILFVYLEKRKANKDIELVDQYLKNCDKVEKETPAQETAE